MPANSEQTKLKKIIIEMLDADGCIFNQIAMNKKREQQAHSFMAGVWPEISFVNDNGLLFDHIKLHLDEAEPDAIDIMCASNRQSNALDAENGRMNKTGSFFPVLKVITHYIQSFYDNVSLNSFLLADLFCNLEVGTAFERAIQSPMKGLHPNCPMEETKILWMLTTLKYLEKIYPENEYELTCYFYDDKQSIIDGLRAWLNTNPDIRSAHINVILNHYDGTASPTAYTTIKGTGQTTDNNYAETAKMLAHTLGIQPNFDWSQCPVNVNVRLNAADVTLKKITTLRQLWPEIMSHSAQLTVTTNHQNGDDDDEENMLGLQNQFSSLRSPKRGTKPQFDTPSEELASSDVQPSAEDKDLMPPRTASYSAVLEKAPSTQFFSKQRLSSFLMPPNAPTPKSSPSTDALNTSFNSTS